MTLVHRLQIQFLDEPRDMLTFVDLHDYEHILAHIEPSAHDHLAPKNRVWAHEFFRDVIAVAGQAFNGGVGHRKQAVYGGGNDAALDT